MEVQQQDIIQTKRRLTKMKEKMRIAIVGCGRFSPFFVPLFKADPIVEEVYVCDLKRERAQKFARILM